MRPRSTVVEFKEERNVTDDFMVNGVRFLEVEKEDGTLLYYPVDDDEVVFETVLTDPREFMDSRYAFARVRSDGTKVMVDDDGIHYDWD